ncbi:MAG: hypothetical protein JNK90_26235 [Planctomycetaceae bacterium]|nr:hypothetical protein [Planctomycetaceae bacterium]
MDVSALPLMSKGTTKAENPRNLSEKGLGTAEIPFLKEDPAVEKRDELRTRESGADSEVHQQRSAEESREGLNDLELERIEMPQARLRETG